MHSLLVALLCVTALACSVYAGDVPLAYRSPDGQLIARIVPTGREAGAKQIADDSDSGIPLEYECRVEVYNRPGQRLWAEDFSSPDGDHGRGVAFARWSPDSRFFVFSTVSSGGHHPWQFFTYAFDRQRQQIYLLDSLVGEVIKQRFALAAPARLTVQVLDRIATQHNPNEEFPARRVTVDLARLLTDKRAPSNPQVVQPSWRGYSQ